jgi:hypothetical protein
MLNIILFANDIELVFLFKKTTLSSIHSSAPTLVKFSDFSLDISTFIPENN